MKTQITKRKLTLKTQKAAPDGAEGASLATAAVATAPRRTVVDTSYHKPAAIMAIIATVIFIGLVTVQVMEWLYYQSPPSVWPLKIPGAVSR